jgi:glycosyltransferase involved in cell wall biosynthesis
VNEQKPLVSVIVRTKDRPKPLKKALQSIAAQTYRPIEVVLVNDGGCNLPEEKFREILGDVSLQYIKLEENRGRAAAGNVGIQNTTGEYIGFLDDDDVFYPEHVTTLIDIFGKIDCRIAYSDAEIVYLSYLEEGDVIEETQSVQKESLDFSYETLLLQNYISFMSLLFHKSVLLEIGGFDEEFDLCEDWDLIIRLGSKYAFYHISKITAKYSFWSKESQVTIGNEKLAPYRFKIISKHLDKITPQVLYDLVYKGKWLGTLSLAEKVNSLEKKMADLEGEISILQTEKRLLEFKAEKKDSLEKKITDLETEIHNLQSEKSLLVSEIEKKEIFEKKIADLEGEISILQTEKRLLETQAEKKDTLEIKITDLEDEINALKSKIESQEAELRERDDTIMMLNETRKNTSDKLKNKVEQTADISGEDRKNLIETLREPFAEKADEFMYPAVSVILRVKNEGQTLESVLQALLAQDYPSTIEPVIVDSGSTDNTLDIAHKYHCKVVNLKSRDFTFGKALNMGYREAGGEIFVNLSGHSIPLNTQFLKNLIEPYRDPLVMATFGRNVPLPEACPSEARDLEFWYPDKWLDVPERFSNGNASLRKSVWEKRRFNEEVTGSEDIIWAKEIISSGFKIVYVPVADVYHSHSNSLKYAFERRFRETKAIVKDGQPYVMSFMQFMKWTLSQTKADLAFAKKKHYGARWYFHIPLYRFFQGYGIYTGAREKEYSKETISQEVESLKGTILAYSDKSYRVIRHEGWSSFFHKVKRKLMKKRNLFQVSLANQNKVAQRDTRSLRPKLPSAKKFKVIFITDPLGFLTNHFRAHNMKEYLAHLGIESDIMQETELDYDRVLTFDIVVLCRVFMNPHIENLVEMCRRLHIPIIFDADDYIIDPLIVDSIASIKSVSEHERELHREGIRKHRKSFEAADFFITPTDYFAGIGRNLGKSSFVIRNGLCSSQLELCKKILRSNGHHDNDHGFHQTVKIGYFSGTKSHQEDFAVVKPALLRVMDDFPHVHMYVGGYLDPGNEFEKFQDRIKKIPFVDIHQLPNNIAMVDINLAPLEVNNPFCEAKSELKYSDAALLKIPTVASPTDAFKWAIQHGFNGFLATSEDEWYECLRRLIEDPELRKTMGQRANEHVMTCYAPNAMATSVRKTYERIISEYRHRIGISDHTLKISFVIPSPEKGSGGHNKIFTASRYLSEWGHSVTIHCLNDGGFGVQEQLKEFIRLHFIDPKSEIILGTDTISSCDVLCATSWKTAYPVYANRDKAAELFYFVQDIESLFFPMGNDYLKADNTYRMGMYHITYGPWCAKVLKERYQAKADFIPFSFDKKMYYPRTSGKGNPKKVVFFGRPEMPRRCFWIGLEALWLFNQRNPDVKIILFGSDQISRHRIPFPHENLGVLTKEELAQLYSSADVGIAFSTTNPSLVPFEMMACGCPVVDLDYNDNYINYGSKENAKLVGISPEEIVNGIEELIKDDDMRHRIAMNGRQFAGNFPDDRDAFMVMEDIFLKAFGLKKSSSTKSIQNRKITGQYFNGALKNSL